MYEYRFLWSFLDDMWPLGSTLDIVLEKTFHWAVETLRYSWHWIASRKIWCNGAIFKHQNLVLTTDLWFRCFSWGLYAPLTQHLKVKSRQIFRFFRPLTSQMFRFYNGRSYFSVYMLIDAQPWFSVPRGYSPFWKFTDLSGTWILRGFL